MVSPEEWPLIHQGVTALVVGLTKGQLSLYRCLLKVSRGEYILPPLLEERRGAVIDGIHWYALGHCDYWVADERTLEAAERYIYKEGAPAVLKAQLAKK
jgi:hypothetical protein